jgi:phosphoribosylformylglycinamidine synthase
MTVQRADLRYLARVYVTLKSTVNDPQGLTIRGALRQLGFAEIDSVRAGKYLEIRVTAVNEGDARERVSEMCRKLLANPVIEEFRFDLESAEG